MVNIKVKIVDDMYIDIKFKMQDLSRSNGYYISRRITIKYPNYELLKYMYQIPLFRNELKKEDPENINVVLGIDEVPYSGTSHIHNLMIENGIFYVRTCTHRYSLPDGMWYCPIVLREIAIDIKSNRNALIAFMDDFSACIKIFESIFPKMITSITYGSSIVVMFTYCSMNIILLHVKNVKLEDLKQYIYDCLNKRIPITCSWCSESYTPNISIINSYDNEHLVWNPDVNYPLPGSIQINKNDFIKALEAIIF